MKPSLLLFFCILICQYPFAQDIENLSYSEIDSLMYIEYNKGAFDKAISLLQAGQDKAKIDFGQQDTIFADYCVWGGFLHYTMGNYDKALPLYIQAINIFEKVFINFRDQNVRPFSWDQNVPEQTVRDQPVLDSTNQSHILTP